MTDEEFLHEYELAQMVQDDDDEIEKAWQAEQEHQKSLKENE